MGMQEAGQEPAERRDDIVPVLAEVPLFSDLPPDALQELASGAQLRRLPRGAWLFRQGELGHSLFTVLSGRLEVVAEDGARQEAVGALTRGALIGELSALAREPRTTSVRAARDSELLEVGREAFMEVLWKNPSSGVLLSTVLARRAQSATSTVAPADRARVLALLPMEPGLPVPRLVEELLGAMGQAGSVGLIYGSEAPQSRLAGRDALIEYGRLLRHEELASERVLLLDDGEGGNPMWTSFCLQHSDAVLAIASPQSPLPEKGLASDLAGCHLVLLGRPGEWKDLGRWLQATNPSAHYFVPLSAGFSEAVGSLARRILRRSVGLVLSGGGAGALAHLGVLEVLLDAGVHIDRVGGCSMGALVAALFALGKPIDEIMAICREELALSRPFRDFTIPRHALIKGRRAEAMLKRLFGTTRVEELPLDFFCVSADLFTADLVVHRDGDLFEAVGVSMSLPGLAPPRAVQGRMLIDGGVLNNLPIDVMAERREGPIIAVDVMRQRLSGSSVQESRGGSLTPRLPRIADTLIQALVLGSHHRVSQNLSLADLLIAPEVTRFALLDFERLDEIVEEGRIGARRALENNPEFLLKANA